VRAPDSRGVFGHLRLLHFHRGQNDFRPRFQWGLHVHLVRAESLNRVLRCGRVVDSASGLRSPSRVPMRFPVAGARPRIRLVRIQDTGYRRSKGTGSGELLSNPATRLLSKPYDG